MSSHREAPEIARIPLPTARTSTPSSVPKARYGHDHRQLHPVGVTGGGPNFYEFGDDVLYEINIDNDGDGVADVTYQFQFNSENTDSLDVPLQRRTNRVADERELEPTSVLQRDACRPSRKDECSATNVPCPPCNIGPLSTPNYASLASAAVYSLADGRQVFAGQRAEAFFVDLGSIFELGTLRPIAKLHATFGLPALAAMPA